MDFFLSTCRKQPNQNYISVNLVQWDSLPILNYLQHKVLESTFISNVAILHVNGDSFLTFFMYFPAQQSPVPPQPLSQKTLKNSCLHKKD